MKPSHELKVTLLALAAGLPAVVTAMALLVADNHSPKVIWTAGVVVLGSWAAFAFAAGERVATPLRTIANLLEAMREGDYSIRARGDRGTSALDEVNQQINMMGATLQEQRLGALEATTLLRKVMEEIDVAVFAFDSERKLKLVNRAAEKLLAKPAERILQSPAESLGLADILDGDTPPIVQRTFPGGSGRWGINRSAFREGGLPHKLLVLSDLTRPLREEELQAWQRLVRVLGHELNNSLTPIKSIAGSLESLLIRQPRADDWEDDMRRGLSVIATRSESLSRFMGSYARLAKLPRPNLAPVKISAWVQHVVGLETRIKPEVEAGPDIAIPGDRDQLDQVLINLLRNAVDASKETGGSVTVGWTRTQLAVEVWVRDRGPGIANTANLFVPFFTTKPGGTGIGLVLSRQIVEAHGGALTLKNNEDGMGCEARITLPG